MKALIIDRVSPLVESGLKEYGVDVDVKILPGVDELKRLLPEYDLLVMRVDPKMDRELLDAADGTVIIPMQSHCESLNAAVAATIVMWQMRR